ncbi:MAG: asparagine synthase (glutamine-hydrolyzing) [Bacteroidetes bacterium]|nr:asparagine synthase (glutamine-hydrolyzing) [Bacteroidota bacterium]
MCGIAGIWHLNKEALHATKLQSFTNSLEHRGPDGFGFYIDEKKQLGLGHRRLSILDLSEAGKQPMSFADGRYWISYNGEVFNFIELRIELKNKGYSFKTETDTEIILAAYHCWGIDCLHKFNGMFALAIWDSAEQKLFLARDRFGIKPLYYAHLPHLLFAFASETIAFKKLENFKRNFNDTNVLLQLKNNNILEGLGYTIYERIFQLLPGHYMMVYKNETPKQKRWWSTLNNIQSVPKKYEEQVEQLQSLLIDSLRLRLRSDVTLATALSGGVDSSSVFCTLNYMMQRTENKERMPDNWQQAFVATFPGTLSDEEAYAKQVIDNTGLKGTFITLDENALYNKIIDTTLKSDAILGSPIVSSYMVYEAMRKNDVTVSMDGHGVDEMLYGYPYLVQAAYRYYYDKHDAENKKDIEQTYKNLFYNEVKESYLEELKNKFPAPTKAQQVKNSIKNSSLGALYRSLKNNEADIALPHLSDRPYNTGKMNVAEKVLFDSFHTGMLPTLLRNFDRASMLNGVEVRMPFMDYRLVQYVFSLPLFSKIGGGYTKRILRDAMKGIVPENIIRRKLKIGLMAPMYDWYNNKLSEVIVDEVNSSAFLNSPYWNGKEIAAYATEKTKTKTWQSGQESMIFWSYLNTHLLHKTNL